MNRIRGISDLPTLMNHNTPYRYVLITPAKNEALFIEKTIKSVISQTALPIRWVIVSDGSIDGTDVIVKTHAAKYDWIEFVQLPARKERHFAGKVYAFNAGLEKVKNLDYDIIGNLDADISFDKDYFAFLLTKFAENPRLGVGGTPFREGSRQYDYRFTHIGHVSGACQLFRRECFESIGGYIPLKAGGIDLAAVLNARMKGWETRTFLERACVHHRKMGTGRRQGLAIRFNGGYHDYLMGASPLWQLFRSFYQMTKKPYVIGGGSLYLGYLWALITRAGQLIPRELVDFRRKEQRGRLLRVLKGGLVISSHTNMKGHK